MTWILTATPEIYRAAHKDDGDRPDLYCCYSPVITVPYNAPVLYMDLATYDNGVIANSPHFEYAGRIPGAPGTIFYNLDYYFYESDYYYQHHPAWGNDPNLSVQGIHLQKRQGGDWIADEEFIIEFIWYSSPGLTCGIKSIRIY